MVCMTVSDFSLKFQLKEQTAKVARVPAARHRTVAARTTRPLPTDPTLKDAAYCKRLDAAQTTASLPKVHILKV